MRGKIQKVSLLLPLNVHKGAIFLKDKGRNFLNFPSHSLAFLRVRWLDSITYLMDKNLGKLWEIVKDRGAVCATVQGVEKSQT